MKIWNDTSIIVQFLIFLKPCNFPRCFPYGGFVEDVIPNFFLLRKLYSTPFLLFLKATWLRKCAQSKKKETSQESHSSITIKAKFIQEKMGQIAKIKKSQEPPSLYGFLEWTSKEKFIRKNHMRKNMVMKKKIEEI